MFVALDAFAAVAADPKLDLGRWLTHHRVADALRKLRGFDGKAQRPERDAHSAWIVKLVPDAAVRDALGFLMFYQSSGDAPEGTLFPYRRIEERYGVSQQALDEAIRVIGERRPDWVDRNLGFGRRIVISSADDVDPGVEIDSVELVYVSAVDRAVARASDGESFEDAVQAEVGPLDPFVLARLSELGHLDEMRAAVEERQRELSDNDE